MKKAIILISVLLTHHLLWAQNEVEHFKFYLGLSYGTSFSIGNFSDKDPTNEDAGFAENGKKIDVYGGYFLNEKFTLNATLRYQVYNADISNIVNEFNERNPGANLSAVSNDWEAYYLLAGISYFQEITRKFHLYPRVALGPIFVSSPSIEGQVPGGTTDITYNRSSEVGIGLGFEVGIGLRTNLGKRFALMPTYDFSGGLIRFSDVETNNNNDIEVREYNPKIRSFNLGLSLAYKFF